MRLLLERPLIFFDLETTGTNPAMDRVVSIAAIKFFPDGSTVEKEQLINPFIPIPPKATAVHSITNEAVADKPSFRQLSKSMFAFFTECDLAGFNVLKFDLPLLQAEFGRVGISNFPDSSTKVVDVQVIYHSHERRTLTDAVKFYCQEPLINAHNALSDVKATVDVFQRQMQVYEELPNSIDGLHRYCRQGKTYADLTGCLIFNDTGEVCFNIGKYREQPVNEITQRDPRYIDWIVKESHYPIDAKVMLKKLMVQST
jgi:DNA polymerase-3 subunit epsilon